MDSKADHPADQELVRAALAVDVSAIDALVNRLRCVPRILVVLNQRMGGALGSEDLRDLTQETLSALWARMENYNGRASLETWAYGFCFNGFMNAVRKGQRRGEVDLREAHQAAVPGPSLSGAMEYEHLHRSLELLDEKDARVIRLKYFEELTFEEIGARLGISPNTAKTCYYRGMKRLEELLRRSPKEVLP